MQTLQQNLISGVVDGTETGLQEPQTANTEKHEGEGTAEPDETGENAQETEADAQAGTGETTGRNENEDMKALFGKFMNHFEDKMREAEDRGFKRALEMARQNPGSLGIEASVPNFLTDIRPDMWEV